MLAFLQVVCAPVRFKAEEKTEEILKVFTEIRAIEEAGRKSQEPGMKRIGQGVNLEKKGSTTWHAGPFTAGWGAAGERGQEVRKRKAGYRTILALRLDSLEGGTKSCGK